MLKDLPEDQLADFRLAAGAAQLLSTTMTFPRPATTLLRVVGEVDLLTVPQLSSHLQEGNDDRGKYLIVDLSTVTFFGAAGYNALCEARRRRGRDSSMTLVASRCVRRVLAICEQDQLKFARAPNCAEAIEACQHRAAW